MDSTHIQTFKPGHPLHPTGCVIETVITEDGVTVTETPGEGEQTVTEHTLAAWQTLQQSQV